MKIYKTTSRADYNSMLLMVNEQGISRWAGGSLLAEFTPKHVREDDYAIPWYYKAEQALSRCSVSPDRSENVLCRVSGHKWVVRPKTVPKKAKKPNKRINYRVKSIGDWTRLMVYLESRGKTIYGYKPTEYGVPKADRRKLTEGRYVLMGVDDDCPVFLHGWIMPDSTQNVEEYHFPTDADMGGGTTLEEDKYVVGGDTPELHIPGLEQAMGAPDWSSNPELLASRMFVNQAV
jgi:hypothetical protein